MCARDSSSPSQEKNSASPQRKGRAAHPEKAHHLEREKEEEHAHKNTHTLSLKARGDVLLCAGLARAAARAACREMGAAAACGEESIARCCAEEARNEYAPLFGVAAAAACLLAVLCLLLQAPPPASLSLSLLNTSPRGEPTFVVLPSLGRCFARGEGGTPRTRGEKEGATHAKQSGVCVCVCGGARGEAGAVATASTEASPRACAAARCSRPPLTTSRPSALPL